MSYTKGPWIARDCSDAFAEKYTIERVTDGLRSVICRINDMEVCPEHGGTGSGANARLIAASPDLLQVCKDFVLLADLHDWEGAAIDHARTVIKQATGAA